MRGLVLTILTLIPFLACTAACERYKPTYKVSKSLNQGPGAPPLPALPTPPGPNPIPQPVPGSSTDITLTSRRLEGPDGKFSGVAKFAGVTSPKTSLVKVEGGMKFNASGLPASKSDLLVVEIYEGDKLRFVAKKAKLELAAPGPSPNLVQVEDCLILTVPWDGAQSEGSCQWVLEETK